jgi:hypothetical protein
MTVNSLWIGKNISLLEKLTIKSFIDNGYTFCLWVYDKELKYQCPDNTVICDAREILNESRIFKYKGGGDCREGSLGGFSDLFRYYLINSVGGLYVDMDVTCLTPFNIQADYGFRPHSSSLAVANILKAPADCDFLKRCIELTEEQIDCNNTTWVKPVEIFSTVVEEYNYKNYIFPYEHFGCDSAADTRDYKLKNYFLYRNKLPTYGIHWCRECSHGTWSYLDIFDWDNPRPLSIYYNLLLKHKLIN